MHCILLQLNGLYSIQSIQLLVFVALCAWGFHLILHRMNTRPS